MQSLIIKYKLICAVEEGGEKTVRFIFVLMKLGVF